MSKTATETLHRILTNEPPADASPEKRLQIIKMRLYALRRLSDNISGKADPVEPEKRL